MCKNSGMVCWLLLKWWCIPMWGCGWRYQCSLSHTSSITAVLRFTSRPAALGRRQKSISVACGPWVHCQVSNFIRLRPVFFCIALLVARVQFFFVAIGLSFLHLHICFSCCLRTFTNDVVDILLAAVGYPFRASLCVTWRTKVFDFIFLHTRGMTKDDLGVRVILYACISEVCF